MRPHHLLFLNSHRIHTGKPQETIRSAYFPSVTEPKPIEKRSPMQQHMRMPVTASVSALSIQFPTTRTVLWDRTPQGPLAHVHWEDYGVSVIVAGKQLETLLMYSEHSPERPAFLIGRFCLDSRNQRGTIIVDRIDSGKVAHNGSWSAGLMSDEDVCIAVFFDVLGDGFDESQIEQFRDEYCERVSASHRFLLRNQYEIVGNVVYGDDFGMLNCILYD